MKSMEVKLSAAQEGLDQAVQDSEQKAVEVARLTETLAALRAKNDGDGQKLQRAEAALSSAQQQVQTAETELRETQQSVYLLEEEVELLGREKEDQQREIDTLNTSLTKASQNDQLRAEAVAAQRTAHRAAQDADEAKHLAEVQAQALQEELETQTGSWAILGYDTALFCFRYVVSGASLWFEKRLNFSMNPKTINILPVFFEPK